MIVVNVITFVRKYVYIANWFHPKSSKNYYYSSQKNQAKAGCNVVNEERILSCSRTKWQD